MGATTTTKQSGRPPGSVRLSWVLATACLTAGAGGGCEIDPKKQAQAEQKLQDAQAQLKQAQEVARDKIERARPEVEKAVGELQEGAQRGYDRASSNLEEATSYHPIEGAADAIDCRGDTCSVDRAFAAQFTEHPEWLARELKLSPAFRGGKIHGLRIAYVPAGSLADLVGLRAGDVVMTVDGKSITSIADLQGLVQQDRRALRDVKIAYLRGGEPKTLTLRQAPARTAPK